MSEELAMQTEAKTELPVGPNIVRAWFDTVISPLLIGLEEEQRKLHGKDWGWEPEPSPGRLRCAREVRDHLDYQAIKNLEQILDHYPEVAALVADHDAAVRTLYDAFARLQVAVKNAPRMEEALARSLSTALPEPDDSALLASRADDRLVRLIYLASYVANGQPVLANYFSMAPIWNRFADDFLGVLETPEVRAVAEERDRAADSLLRAVNRLYSALDEIWRQLSARFDVPFYERKVRRR